MRMTVLTLLSLLPLSLCCSATTVLVAPTRLDVLHVAMDATVGLTDADNEPHCAGVVTSGDRVVTAAHCVRSVEPGGAVRVGFLNDWAGPAFRRTYNFRVASTDVIQDLAVLVSDGEALPPHSSLPVAEDDPVAGQAVWSIGHPLGLGYTVTQGIVSYPTRVTEDGSDTMLWTQIETKVYFGNSGGPLVTESGEVLGITSFLINGQAHLAGCAHVRNIRHILGIQ